MSAATDAFSRMSTAMLTIAPACQSDDRFTADDQDAEDLRHVCHGSPLFDLCGTYARATHPKAGVWAGRRWTRHEEGDQP